MATVYRPWTAGEAEQVKGLMMQGSGAEEIAAVMECPRSQLNRLCRDAFGLTFAKARAKYRAVGNALLLKSLFASALEGNPKAIDMLARERLAMGPVEQRRARAREQEAPAEPEPKQKKVTQLEVIQGRYHGPRRTGTDN